MVPHSPTSLSRPRSIRSAPARPLAFTLIELLVVMSVIAILLGMFLVAYKYVKNAGARSSTKISMDSLKGMLGDLRRRQPPESRADHVELVSGDRRCSRTGRLTTRNSGTYGRRRSFRLADGSTADFWRYPFSANEQHRRPRLPTPNGKPSILPAKCRPISVRNPISNAPHRMLFSIPNSPCN